MRPLAVRVVTRDQDRIVTDRVSDLSWTKTAPGGWSSGTFRLSIGYDDLPIPALSYVEVTDAATGRVVMCGYTDQPGRGYDGAQGYDVSFAGPTSVLEDQRRALTYIDSGYENFGDYAGSNSAFFKSGSASTGSLPNADDVSAIVDQFPSGTPVPTGAFVGMRYSLANSDMVLGAYSFLVQAGISDSGWGHRINAGGTLNDRSASTTAATRSSTHSTFGDAVNYLDLHFRRAGADTNVGTDNIWGAYRTPVVKGRLLNASGSTYVMDATPYLYAYHVVSDVLGRMCPLIDGPTATIALTNTQIDQLVYSEATTALQVLDDLAANFEPDMLYYVGARMPNGKHAFAYRAWPALTSPRYEISQSDGLEITGREGGDLANRITVTWTEKGKARSVVRTRVTPELVLLGRVIEAEPISLPDGQGSLANAQRIGDATLAQMADQGVSGRAVVARSVRDLDTGAQVMPWEMEAGEIAVVRETGECARVTQVDVDSDDTIAATLTLGQPTRSTDQLIAAGLKKRR